jgi:hypothetical protein
MKKILNEGNHIRNFISSSGSGTVIDYGSGSDSLTIYGSGSASQNVTIPTVPVPQHSIPVVRTVRYGYSKLPPGADTVGTSVFKCVFMY